MRIFKIRCSAIGSIMAYPDKKELPVGAKTYIHEWVKEQLYERHKTFTSKYTDKGLTVEDQAIEFAANYYGWGLVSKNEINLDNEWMTGTPDLILADLIPDLKASWDCFSFPLLGDKLNSDYEWQMNGYMCLTDKDKSAVIYTLMDAPDAIIEKEARSQSYRAGLEELEMVFYNEVKATMTYSNLPDNLRIRKFDVVRDDKKIQQIKDRVELCREYIGSLNLNQYDYKILKAA